jgi:hypothetical protein
MPTACSLAPWATCWRWLEITTSPPAHPSGGSASTRSPPPCPPGRGTATASARARKEHASATGPVWRSPHQRASLAAGRRTLTNAELAFYRCWSPTLVSLPALVRVAGTYALIQLLLEASEVLVATAGPSPEH